jgi:hypothetical protein
LLSWAKIRVKTRTRKKDAVQIFQKLKLNLQPIFKKLMSVLRHN